MSHYYMYMYMYTRAHENLVVTNEITDTDKNMDHVT